MRHKELEEAGLVSVFDCTYRCHPDVCNMLIKKSVPNLNRELPIKAFKKILEGDEDLSIWCTKLTKVIIKALKKQDQEKLSTGLLKRMPKYLPYVEENNISIQTANGVYAPLDHAIMNKEVGGFFEWTCKCIEEIVEEDGALCDTVEDSAWQLTIYKHHENL